MNTIGSHPGAIIFRLAIMLVLILILILVFLSYIEDAQQGVERSAILQTKRIIDSSLAVVFARYAVNGRLDDLNEISGGNPFVFLKEFETVPPTYQGVIDIDISTETPPGWYYLAHRRLVAYRARYIETDSYFAIVLNYEDKNHSGKFEAQSDVFKNLQFVKKAEI